MSPLRYKQTLLDRYSRCNLIKDLCLNLVNIYVEKQSFEVVLEKRCSEKQLYQKRDTGTGVSCEFCEICKNTFFDRTPPVAASLDLFDNLQSSF